MVISHDNLSRKKRLLLRKNNVKVVDVGFQVNHSNFGRAVRILVDKLRLVLRVCERVVTNYVGFSKLTGFIVHLDVFQCYLPDFRGFG